MIKKKLSSFLKFKQQNKSFSMRNYEILGVSKSANKEEIKEAYYKLAKLYHPDLKKSNSNLKFYDIQRAYEELLIEKENINEKEKDTLKRDSIDELLNNIIYTNNSENKQDKERNIPKDKNNLFYYSHLDYFDVKYIKYIIRQNQLTYERKRRKQERIKIQNENFNIHNKNNRFEKFEKNISTKEIEKKSEQKNINIPSNNTEDLILSKNYKEKPNYFITMLKFSTLLTISYFLVYKYKISGAIASGVFLYHVIL